MSDFMIGFGTAAVVMTSVAAVIWLVLRGKLPGEGLPPLRPLKREPNDPSQSKRPKP
jgi:hypothetical protein